jgi:hypothetical protein
MSPIKLKPISKSRIIGYIFFTLACLAFLVYVAFQARFVLMGPQVTLTEELPANQSSQKIFLRGQTSNITEISLNGRGIMTNESGYFEEPLILENGYTIASIRAKDRYGREVVLERKFVYTPLSLLQ